MAKNIPEHIRIEQINSAGKHTFLKWVSGYKNNKSKALLKCNKDGFEWSTTINSLVSGQGCPQCGGVRRWTAEERVAQINSIEGVEFVRWVDGYSNVNSKALLRCSVDGLEWEASVHNTVNGRCGCPQCSKQRRLSEAEQLSRLRDMPEVEFVEFCSEYRGSTTSCLVKCSSCSHLWRQQARHLVAKTYGCPSCAGTIKKTESYWTERLRTLDDMNFCGWDGEFKNGRSKAIMECRKDHFIWSASIGNLLRGSQCPSCASRGYNPKFPGTLYALRSDCGEYCKIGITNNYRSRITALRRGTPFGFKAVERFECENGETVRSLEKALHAMFEPARFGGFDGATEWFLWDSKLTKIFRSLK